MKRMVQRIGLVAVFLPLAALGPATESGNAGPKNGEPESKTELVSTEADLKALTADATEVLVLSESLSESALSRIAALRIPRISFLTKVSAAQVDAVLHDRVDSLILTDGGNNLVSKSRITKSESLTELQLVAGEITTDELKLVAGMTNLRFLAFDLGSIKLAEAGNILKAGKVEILAIGKSSAKAADFGEFKAPKNVQSLSIQGAIEAPSDLEPLFKDTLKLTYLAITGPPAWPKGIIATLLNKVELTGLMLSGKIEGVDRDAIAGETTIRTLTMITCGELPKTTFEKLGKLEHLETLIIADCDGVGVECLDLLAKSSTLKHLCLYGCRPSLSEEQLMEVLPALVKVSVKSGKDAKAIIDSLVDRRNEKQD